MKLHFNTFEDQSYPLLNKESRKDYFERFKKVINRDEIGFFHLKDIDHHISECKKVFEKFKHKKCFVQIGIGGSALGPQMLIDAFSHEHQRDFLFLDNTDSEYISDVLRKIKTPKDVLFYVVSKSGSTAETIACFAIAKNFLSKNNIKEEDLKNYFVFCTDKEKGQLREYANSNEIDSLEVPSDIGGRFSVLTPVGLLPALFANININNLIDGARFCAQEVLTKKDEHDLFKLASIIATLHESENISQTVLMPYSSKLKTLSHWFVQLWGESLGKFSFKHSTNKGLTPIPAYGATDQHSQMQLFMQGPFDKLLILIGIKDRSTDFSLNAQLDIASAKDLSPYRLNQLIDAQLKGTLTALKENKRNTIYIELDRNDEFSLGKVILFFESLTALMGEYLDVDAFDQPGVELGKKFAYEYLKNLA